MALLSPKTPSFLVFFFILCSLLLPSFSVFANTHKCIKEHFSALLHLKHGFNFSDYSRSTLPSWNSNNTDCCSWEGITCDGDTGHVISLDLSSFRISGRIDSESLFRLWSLRRLNLAYNNFAASQIPSGFDQLTSLTHLNFSGLKFYGQIPLEISHLTSLVSLDLSYNYHSNGSVFLPLKLENPNIGTLFQNLSSLQELYLFYVNISMQGSEWGQTLFLSLPRLRKLSLPYCGISGTIHSSLSQLRFLSELDLSNNNLSGSLPTFHVNLSKLEHLDLSFNSFSGPIPSSYGNQLLNLKQIIFLSNLLNGTIPSSLFSLPSLKKLDLGYNKLGGRLDVIHNVSSTQLEYFYLDGNNFQGTIPRFIFQLTKLRVLYVSSNNFSGVVINNASSTQLEEVYLDHNNFQGTVPSFIFKLMKLRTISLSFNNFSGDVEIGSFQTLKNLSSLDLSDNNLSIEDSGGNSTFASFPQIRWLSLRSCNITKFPNFLRNQKQMGDLDLSNNRITGGIPKWIWKVGNATLYNLNLSRNALQRIEPPFLHVSFSDRVTLDLSSNKLEGSLPIPPPSTSFFSLSNNSFSGKIPTLICNTTSLQVLDLSRNWLSGWIPQCLGEISDGLMVLNLQGNAFSGALLQTFKKGCNLQTLDLSKNHLEGQVPRSLANCTMLEVLNLGNNQINDAFPSWVEALYQLRVLVLKSNKFYGQVTLPQSNKSFPMLQIIDLSFNSFMGDLPSNLFQSWKAMAVEDKSQSEFRRRRLNASRSMPYYQDTVTITMKGHERELTKILTIFTTIDLSNNYFQGDIPESIGILKSLRLLNLSRNGFTGQIPTSLQNLRVLESLDLSQNNISGEIPGQLTELTFLSVLNLSQNHLVGSIPQIKQFSTFTNESFEGNLGLCGPPLSRKCISPQLVMPTFEHTTSDLDWAFMCMGFGVGYGVGMGVLFWTLILWTKERKEYNKFIDGMLSFIFSYAIFSLKRQPKWISVMGRVEELSSPNGE